MATERRSKSPSPCDDEYYDAFEESSKSDKSTFYTTAPDLPDPTVRASGEREDRIDWKDGKVEVNQLTSCQEEMENRLRDSLDSPSTHTLSPTAALERQDDLSASTSASFTDLSSSLVNKCSSCSETDSPSNDVTTIDSSSTTAELSLASTSPVTPMDCTSITGETSSNLTSSIPSDELDSYSTSINSCGSSTSGSVSSNPSSPKKTTKKQSTLKWTTAAREVVQGGHSEEGSFRRSSSSSSLSSGLERRISSSSMLDDIAQVREREER